MAEIPGDLGTVFDTELVRLDQNILRRLNPRRFPLVAATIDRVGKLSSESQGIKKGQLTSYEKLLDSEYDFGLYLLWRQSIRKPGHSTVIGLLKVARKQLYLYDKDCKECKCVRALCVLDFYVVDPLQRQGNGHRLFQYMLDHENIRVEECAIDKPSSVLLTFMQKHFGLTDPIWQTTHYVVYPEFFEILKDPNWQRTKITSISLVPSKNSNNGVNDVPSTPLSVDSLASSARSTIVGRESIDHQSMDTDTFASGMSTPVRRRHDSGESNASYMSNAAASRQRKVLSLGHQHIW